MITHKPSPKFGPKSTVDLEYLTKKTGVLIRSILKNQHEYSYYYLSENDFKSTKTIDRHLHLQGDNSPYEYCYLKDLSSEQMLALFEKTSELKYKIYDDTGNEVTESELTNIQTGAKERFELKEITEISLLDLGRKYNCYLYLTQTRDVFEHNPVLQKITWKQQLFRSDERYQAQIEARNNRIFWVSAALFLGGACLLPSSMVGLPMLGFGSYLIFSAAFSNDTQFANYRPGTYVGGGLLASFGCAATTLIPLFIGLIGCYLLRELKNMRRDRNRVDLEERNPLIDSAHSNARSVSSVVSGATIVDLDPNYIEPAINVVEQKTT